VDEKRVDEKRVDEWMREGGVLTMPIAQELLLDEVVLRLRSARDSAQHSKSSGKSSGLSGAETHSSSNDRDTTTPLPHARNANGTLEMKLAH
jgi:hypothetical protein